MVDRVASNMTEINTALGLSSGGDTITVTPPFGSFSGDLTNYSFGSEVIIRASDPANRPDFGFTRISNCDNLAFEDIEFTLNDLFTDGGSICIVQDGSTNIRLERCHSAGRSKCFFLNGGSGHTMRDCTVDRVGQGGYTIQAVSNTLIHGCSTLGLHFMDGASHGDFMQFSGTCDGITVEDCYQIDAWSFNETKSGATVTGVSGTGTVTVTTGSAHGLSTNQRVAILDPDGLRADGYGWFTVTVLNSTQFTVSTTSSLASGFVGLDVLSDSGSIIQGIFISNGAFTNFIVRNNIIMTNAIGGIHEQPSTITANSGHTVQNNTVLNNGNGNSTQIGWSGTSSSSGNIAEVGFNTGLQTQDNNSSIPATPPYYEELYSTLISGDGVLGGRSISNFAIVPSSIAVDNGAFALINELLGNEAIMTNLLGSFGELAFGEPQSQSSGESLTAENLSVSVTGQDATTAVGHALVAEQTTITSTFQDAVLSEGILNTLIAETCVLSCDVQSAQIGDGAPYLPKGLKLKVGLGIS